MSPEQKTRLNKTILSCLANWPKSAFIIKHTGPHEIYTVLGDLAECLLDQMSLITPQLLGHFEYTDTFSTSGLSAKMRLNFLFTVFGSAPGLATGLRLL